MKKVVTAFAALAAFIAGNEILTWFLIAVGITVVAVILVAAWAKTEKPKIPGSFNADWGKK